MDKTLIYPARKGRARLNRISVFLSAALLVALMTVLPNCGKKGPPFLTKSKFSLRVDQLKAEKENGRLFLKGSVRGEDKIVSGVIGCRVYHAWYSMDNPPCEGCPIEMAVFKEIKEKVVSGNRFNYEVLDVEEKGIHFFEVRLMGRGGAVGPPSGKAKFRIDD